MSEPLENLYFNWLCAKVIDPIETSPGLTYWKLFTRCHKTEFVWLLSGDDNRAEDGKDLRREFLIAADLPDDIEWRLAVGASMLEVLVAFSRTAQDVTDRAYREWFWEFLDNLGLTEFNDANYLEEAVDVVLYDLIWREYGTDGTGGMFPLRAPPENQKTTEIWYQFCDYLVDRERIP